MAMICIDGGKVTDDVDRELTNRPVIDALAPRTLKSNKFVQAPDRNKCVTGPITTSFGLACCFYISLLSKKEKTEIRAEDYRALLEFSQHNPRDSFLLVRIFFSFFKYNV